VYWSGVSRGLARPLASLPEYWGVGEIDVPHNSTDLTKQFSSFLMLLYFGKKQFKTKLKYITSAKIMSGKR